MFGFGKNKTSKILVEIIGTARSQKRKLEIDETGATPAVVTNKGGMGRGDLRETATFTKDCLVPYSTGFLFFKATRFKLLLKKGAAQCVSFADSSGDTAPSLTKNAVKDYAKAQVLKIAGSSTRMQIGLALYLLVIVAIIVGIINILIQTGNLRL